MIDCLLVGFNESNFANYVTMVKMTGVDAGEAYRDLRLSSVEYNGKPYRSIDLLNHFYFQEKENKYRPFHNADFLWPVILYLGTYLSRRGFTFDYVNLFHLEKDKLKEKLIKNEILTIAITTTLYFSMHPILEIITFIRRYNKTAKIVVGGPFIHSQVETRSDALANVFKYIGADYYIVSQEGEHALGDLLVALKQGTGVREIPNLAYKQGKDYVLTSCSSEHNPLDENMVDYSLFPKDEIGEFVSTRISKSCPFACAFCSFPERAGKYTYLDPELVEKELDAIREIGSVSTITFVDDTFNVPKCRFKEILRMMIRKQYNFKWNCFYRASQGDDETIALMKEAGCEGVFLGVESGSDEILKRMNKSARRQNYLQAIRQLRAVGIITHVNLIVGFPGETYKTALESASLVEEAKPDTFRALVWYCDPLTPIWKQRESYNIQGSGFNWSHNTMDTRTAGAIADEMFLTIQNSTWLPQWGFDQWSIFYLMRKGWSFQQVMAFIKSFNAIVKEQVLEPGCRTISPHLLGELRRYISLLDGCELQPAYEQGEPAFP